jgi:hypothetical protein
MRPWTLLKPCPALRKYVGVFDEQPMPDSFATRCGGIASSQNAWMIAAEMESWPQAGAQRRHGAFIVAARQPRTFVGNPG